MNKRFSIISIPNCKFCRLATTLLNGNNLDYSELVVNINGLSKKDRYKYLPEKYHSIYKNRSITFPIILEYDNYIGGYSELRSML